MAKKRITFSEHWYRVCDLRPRLISAVRLHKQFFRGREWYIIRSPLNQDYLRLDGAAYSFIGLLDGYRTVAEAWKISIERLGDAAPTQNEAIQIIGQLYTSNLLRAEIPPDAESLFGRYKKRRNREVKSAFQSFLFPRFKLWDPDAFLARWVGVVGWIFTWKGAVLWTLIILAGLYSLAGHGGSLYDSSAGVLSPSNLPLLYGAFVLAKAVHEGAHAFSCKCLGRFEQNSGHVHNTGIMLLLFTPAPYVDASASWAFRSKWRRMMVAAAGVWSELALASVAAIVWTRTAGGSTTNALAYNLMFVASVSTLLFNGNPLLRYDAYYILCDLLEMPNLGNRGQQYVYYLVKRYVWNVKDAAHQARGAFEKFIFVAYAVASNIYRVFLLSGILLTIADMAFFIGVILALGSLVMWLFVPLFKFVRCLAVNPELGRTRIRAMLTTSCFAALLFFLVGLLNVPDRFQIEGVVESDSFTRVHSGSSGFLVSVLDSEEKVAANTTVLAELDNPSLRSEWRVLTAKEKEIHARIRIAEATDPAEAIAARERLLALEKEKARVARLLKRLKIVSSQDGVWVSPLLSGKIGGYITIGDAMGDVITLDSLTIRSIPGQDAAMSLITESKPLVELRVKGRADLETTAKIVAVIPGGRKELPSPALGYPAGGETAVDASDSRGLTPEEHVFEIKLGVHGAAWRMLPGQVVTIRFTAADKPIAVQAWRSLLQMLQRRFNV
ncbi:MAG: hypothetical protein LBU23_10555 [Planctomycetota bacterium]|jgi:putative peptide zinc metalloprotease protein|nr:hypothetical protein [Planctomycetota bacterium]